MAYTLNYTGEEVAQAVENALTPYETTGQGTDKGMTQKAVTDELIPLKNNVNGYDVTEISWNNQSLTANKYYNTTNATVGETWNFSTSTGNGSYCKSLQVTAGQVYRIYGYAIGGAGCQYVTLDSTKKVLYKKTGIQDTRSTPAEVTIAQDGYLVVNFNGYNSSTDKLQKRVSTTEHYDGLIERVEALEELPNVNVIDNLTSTNTEDALSANQGKVLNEKIDGALVVNENIILLKEDKYYNTTNATVGETWDYATSTGSGSCCQSVSVSAGEQYRIYGYAAGGAVCQYVILDSTKKVLVKKTGIQDTRTTPAEITIEQNGYLVVNLQTYDSTTDKFCKVVSTMEGGVEQEIDALDARVTTLENQGKPLTGKTIVCFGDSLTQLQGDVDNKRWTDFFQEITGATIINVGIGGARLCQRRYDSSIITNPETEGYTNVMNIFSALDVVNMVRAACGMSFNENYTYLQLAQQFVTSTGDAGKVAAVARLAEIDWSKVDVVFVMAGANDWNSNQASGAGSHGTSGSKAATTTLGAINVIVESLLSTYKHVNLFWATEYPIYHGDTRSTEYYGDNCEVNGMTQKQHHAAIQNEVELNHIPVCDLYNTLGWNEYNFSQYFRNSDSTHAFKGFKQVAEKIAAFIIANKNF